MRQRETLLDQTTDFTNADDVNLLVAHLDRQHPSGICGSTSIRPRDEPEFVMARLGFVTVAAERRVRCYGRHDYEFRAVARAVASG